MVDETLCAISTCQQHIRRGNDALNDVTHLQAETLSEEELAILLDIYKSLRREHRRLGELVKKYAPR